jgi:lipoic acid synthetase
MLNIINMQEFSPQKPGWLKVRPPKTEKYNLVKKTVADLGLNTVCTSAKCPNAFECWDRGSLTFMILGNVCTRACRFCTVAHARRGQELDLDEPALVAEAAHRLGLSYVVITSVDRDDLDDFGAGHYVECIQEIKKRNPDAKVEAIIPDFSGNVYYLRKVIDAGPDVIAHNVETVESMSPTVRDRRAGYYRSIDLLRNVKRYEPAVKTKSSIMLGLGEEEDEVKETIRRLHEARVDVLTMGQYLCPGESCLPVQRYVPPEEFDRLKDFAESLGFGAVAAGPFVRSSYRAAEYFKER